MAQTVEEAMISPFIINTCFSNSSECGQSERFIAELLHIVKRSGTMFHRQAGNEARLSAYEAHLR